MKYLITVIILIITAPVSFALTVGDKAPLFEAPSTAGTIKLQDYKGSKNVVLAFYFSDFTPV